MNGENMATPKSQRIGIWIIAVAMIVGTLGSFAVMVLSNKNQVIDQEQAQKQLEEAQKEQQQAAEAQAAKAQPLKGYKAEKFNAKDVDKLETKVLVKGKGDEIKDTDSLNVSYFGWLPSGKIFDSSTKSGKDTPVTLPLNGVITGWTEGLKGEKVGSTVKLVIPAEKAYGDQTSGIIPANTPLTFIVKVHNISKVEE